MTPWAVVWLGVAALAAGLVMSQVLARRWLALALAVLMALGLAGPPRQPGWPPRAWDLVVCDIGQGDALVLRAGQGVAVVVDAGPDPAAMRRCLDELEITQVPLLVLTHFHADHVDGLVGVFEHRRVGRVWVSPLTEPGAEVAEVVRLGLEHGAPVESPPPGTRAQAGEVTLSVLGPVPHLPTGEDESSVQNDFSLVIRAAVPGLSILLTGDVEPAGQRAILATGADLTADVLKIPHHGSARQDRDFFAATHASVAIASAGVDNDYGHPAPRTVELARSLGMTVLHTDRDGAIAVARGPDRPAAVTQR